eukprot:Nk52_evm60s62 gene=Nk52_evmTU60s62
MPAVLSYVAKPQAPASDAFENRSLVFVGHQKDIVQYTDTLGDCSQGFQMDTALFKSVVSAASVNEFSGGSCSIVCKNNSGSGFTKVSALLVPTVCSRHNSPFRPDTICELIGKLAKADGVKEPAMGHSQIVVVLPKNVNSDFDNALASGSAIARPFHMYTRVNDASTTPSTLKVYTSFFSQSTNSYFEKVTEIEHVAFGIRHAARLHDMPCNELHCSAYVQEARDMIKRLQAAGHDVDIEVIEGEELNRRGFGGIYGVGKAAVNPPALVILKYLPASATETVAWVGKGIVYDTGGLSIKSKTGMPGMKADMGGSAMAMCSFEASVKCGIQYKLYTLLCLAENAVGPIATRPDDIHTLYSGKTVEINNTDAEGRLVMSDGVAYCAKHLNCDYILDMATLTGAQGMATGQYFASIVCSDDNLEEKTIKAGKRSGDMVWPMIYAPELLKQEFSSKVADMKNSVKNRSNAQVSCAAQFVANNLCGFEKPWMHIDMAALANRGERGTGYGVSLLLDLFVFNKV